ncbi:hypothetical protein MUA02_03595 [Enterobacteriaceae bacterium H20N1]|uniref:Uncharacterized protein n=1 Tax=Dryocola boscaweniae TaxID=2925397 RepID=A0A9X2W5R5_9ENTR|nr:hypothetical protein [Dryocola boscaweniae]MCT4701086.1 hypothetical protein [Dryocola boscaweniae]MCT4714526.1 hypothetical protein [Dryocola boscaweniae]MCT4718130.1 hypothetical protein [Dryocola boscaweniae]
MAKRVPDEYAGRTYPVEEDMRWQLKEWSLEKWGARCLMALVALALMGAFSDGWLSQTTTANPDGTLSVEHQRIMRAMSDENFTLRVKLDTGQPTVLTLGQDFMDNFEIQNLHPQPFITHTSLHEMVLTWPANSGKEQALWLTVQPQSAGHFTSTIRLKGAEPVTLSQWVLP